MSQNIRFLIFEHDFFYLAYQGNMQNYFNLVLRLEHDLVQNI